MCVTSRFLRRYVLGYRIHLMEVVFPDWVERLMDFSTLDLCIFVFKEALKANLSDVVQSA